MLTASFSCLFPSPAPWQFCLFSFSLAGTSTSPRGGGRVAEGADLPPGVQRGGHAGPAVGADEAEGRPGRRRRDQAQSAQGLCALSVVYRIYLWYCCVSFFRSLSFSCALCVCMPMCKTSCSVFIMACVSADREGRLTAEFLNVCLFFVVVVWELPTAPCSRYPIRNNHGTHCRQKLQLLGARPVDSPLRIWWLVVTNTAAAPGRFCRAYCLYCTTTPLSLLKYAIAGIGRDCRCRRKRVGS